jgi:hypothetical protein
MNPQKILAVVVTVVLFTSFGQIVPAFSQIEEMAEAPRVNPDIGFGWSIAGDCDLDGDGTPDLIVGGPAADPPGKPTAGRVWIFSGPDGHVICILDGEAAGDRFGFSVSCGGDLNNDGTPDFIVGAPGHNSNTGKVYVYSGETFSLLQTFTGEAAGDKFGFSVSGAGDVNTDGCRDLIMGAPGADWADLTHCGKIYLYHGCSWTMRWDDHGQRSYDSLGYSVSGGCDVNNDGYDDIIVGAPYFDGPGKTDNGRAYIESGFDRTLLCWSFGEQSYDHLGWSVSCVGYFDTDSDADFIIGAPGHDNETGKAYVCEHAPLIPPLYLRVLCDLPGGQAGDEFGWSVSGAGDVNNDGRADVIIGAPGADNGKGKAYVYLGPNCSAHCISLGREAGERFGFSVSSAGDVAQGDNHDDMIIGAPFRACPPCIGRAYVQSGEEGCPEIFDFSPVYPCMNITSPPGDTCLQGGTQYLVKWDTCYVHFFPYVMMKYSLDRGEHWSNWIYNIPNTGTYSWAVPDTCADSCLIEMCISITCPSACDESNYFSIGRLKVISPNGGERWCVDSTYNITWCHLCFSGNVKIDYSTDGGENWLSVVENTSNDGVHPWTIPPTPSEHCKVRICGAVDGDPCDTSNADFAIITYCVPILTNYGIVVLLILLMGTAVWMVRRKRLAMQRNN